MHSFCSFFLALLLVACGAQDSAPGTATQGPAPGGIGAFLVASDDTICSEGSRKVYYQPAVPGAPAVCYCAERAGRDTAASPETSNLIVVRPNGTTYVVTGVQKGTGAGKWNDTWSAAGCPG